MQTRRDCVISVGQQAPLLNAEQLHVGALLTGIGMSHLWEIVEIAGSNLHIAKLPRVAPLCEGSHTLSPLGRGSVCSRCPIRVQAMTEFLPLKPDKARVHVIVPSAPVETPVPYTVYGGLSGVNDVKLYHVMPNGQWNEPLPPYARLHKIWSIPAGLQQLAATGPTLGEVDPED